MVMPCKDCVTYPMCVSKAILECPIMNDYVLEFGIKKEHHANMNIHSIHYREFGWTLIPDRLKEVLGHFNAEQYSASYSMGSVTIYPTVTKRLGKRIKELQKDGQSLQHVHHISDLSEQDGHS